MFFGVCYLALDLSLVPEVGGASSEFPVNMHQKEQLHESVMSMMQSRNLPVSLVLYVPYYYRQSDTIYFLMCSCFSSCRWGDLLDSAWGVHIHHIISNNSSMLNQ